MNRIRQNVIAIYWWENRRLRWEKRRWAKRRWEKRRWGKRRWGKRRHSFLQSSYASWQILVVEFDN